MTTLRNIAIALIAATFVFTSCQKENINELATPETTTTAQSQRDLPAEGIHIVNTDVKTQATMEGLNEQATSRARAFYSIECGSRYRADTRDEGNSANAYHYPDCVTDAVGDDYEGNDMFFILDGPAGYIPDIETTHTITISKLTADLDLFLFAIDNHKRITGCVAVSITPGLTNEQIVVKDLAPGAYLVVVDGYAHGVGGSYKITVDCKEKQTYTPGPSGYSISSVKYGSERTPAYLHKYAGTHGNGWTLTDKHGRSTNYKEKEVTQSSVTMERTTVNGNETTVRNIKVNLDDWTVVWTEAVYTPTTAISSTGINYILEAH